MTTNNLLLTGAPAIGKTTVLRRALASLDRSGMRGFFTDELRSGGRRVGFALVALDGAREILAHVQMRSPHRVGRYFVDVTAVDRAVRRLAESADGCWLYVVDEIGKMECLSAEFVATVEALLDSDRPVLGTIALRAAGPIADFKTRADVSLLEVTHANRDRLPKQVADWAVRHAPAARP